MEFISKTLDSSNFKETVYDTKEKLPLKNTESVLPYNNLSKYGYSITRDLTCNVSITKPRFVIKKVSAKQYYLKQIYSKQSHH